MKIPFVNTDRSAMLTQRFPASFHIYSKKMVREQALTLKRTFSWHSDFFAIGAILFLIRDSFSQTPGKNFLLKLRQQKALSFPLSCRV